MITFERLQLVKAIITQLIVLLDYNYFSNYYKMIAIIDLSKQQAIDADSKAMNTANQFHCNSK